MSAIQKMLDARFEELQARRANDEISAEELSRLEQRRWHAERDPIRHNEFMGIAGILLVLIAVAIFMFRTNDDPLTITNVSMLLVVSVPISAIFLFACVIVSWILSLIVGKSIGDAILFGLLITVPLLLIAISFVPRETIGIPPIVWGALIVGGISFLWRLRSNFERMQRMKLLLSSLPN